MNDYVAYARAREWRRLEYLKKQDEFIVNDIQSTLASILADIEAEANSWYLKYANDNGITVAEAQKIAETADVAHLKSKAKEYVRLRWENRDTITPFTEKAMKEMAEFNFSMKISRHDLLKRFIEMAFIEGYEKIDNKLVHYLTNMTAEELKRQAGILGKAVKAPEDLLRDAEVIARSSFHGETFSGRLWKHQDVLQKYLNGGISQSILMGKHPTAWMGSLAPFLRNVQRNGNYALKRLAVTEAGRVQIEAQKASYEQYGYDKYMVICEPTACPHCMEFDREVMATKDMVIGENAPMFHPNCRCSTAAHMDRREVEQLINEYKETEGQSPLDSSEDSKAPAELASCKDFSELSSMLNEKYGISMNKEVEELEYDLVRDTLNGFESLAKKYPDMAKRIKEISTSSSGVMSCDGTKITFNPAYYDNKRLVLKKINEMTEIGWWSKNTTVGSIGAHETGHAINYDLICRNPDYSYDFEKVLDWNGDKTAKKIVSQACKEVKKTPHGKGKRYIDLRNEQSRYGASNEGEAVAEAYADEFANGANASPLSLKIIEIIDSMFTQYGG